MAPDRIHSAVNLALLPLVLVGANVTVWCVLPAGGAILASILGTPVLLFLCHRGIPALTGPLLNRLFRDPPGP